MQYTRTVFVLLMGVSFNFLPAVLYAQSLPQPTYPCHVESVQFPETAVTDSEQVITVDISYNTPQPIDVFVEVSDAKTRAVIDGDSFAAKGSGEQTVESHVAVASTAGSMQLIYEVNYYSEQFQRTVSCENGADYITIAVVEEPQQTNTAATVDTANINTIFLTPEESQQAISEEANEPGASPWPLVGVILGGGSIIGVGFWSLRNKTRTKKAPNDSALVQPVQPKKPVGGPKETYACSCTVEISAPASLPLCTCWHSPLKLGTSSGDGAKAFLDVNDLQKKCTHSLVAKCTPSCVGAPRNLLYTWKLLRTTQANQPLPKTIEIGCAASFDAILPDGTTTHVQCTTSKEIAIVSHPCEVNVIYVSGAGGDTGYGHVAMQITCGPNSVVYGYYSANNSLSGPGQVLSHDDPGEQYENFYPDYERLVFDVKTINGGKKLNCRQCQRLVNFWKFLQQDPGIYGGDNTCTTRLADALEAIGLIDMKNFKKSFWGPVVGTNDMALSYPSQFINILFQGIAPKGVYPPGKGK